MASHICRAVEIGCVCTPQVPDIVGLQDEDEDPVDACKHRVEREWGRSMTVLTPNSMTVVVMAISRLIERIVGTRDYEEQPCHDGEDLVGKEIASREFFSFGEWVVCLVSLYLVLGRQYLQSEMAIARTKGPQPGQRLQMVPLRLCGLQ